MPGPVSLCTTADVYRRIGGQAALAQLLDPEGTGTWDTTTLTLAIQDASSEVIMAAGAQSQISATSQEQYAERFPELVTLAAQRALVLVWIYGTSGRAMPAGIETVGALANQKLEDLRARKAKHGAVDYSPEPSHRIASVDMDPDRSRVTLASWKSGWC